MEKTLVVMAAGMGSRFGGLKQIEPMGVNGEFLIDYSIYDAKKAGFTKVVFIIKEENYEIFKETIGKRVEPHIECAYAFQKMDALYERYPMLKEREKPLGTAHAILCAKDFVTSPFAIINADDFYGRDAYLTASAYLDTIDSKHDAIVGYKIGNTLSENGSAKRGICKVKDGYLVDIVESSVERKEGKIIATPLDLSPSFEIEEDTISSMNLMLFTPSLFSYLEKELSIFLEENKDNLTTCEFLIPNVVKKRMEEGILVSVLKTDAVWQGVTYKEDKEKVVSYLKQITEEGVYPNPLWEE